jgi:uncharacterized membrane protein YphA (DoxX/SURF4 family)
VTSTMPADLLLLFARLLVCTVFIVSAVDKFNLVPAELAAMRSLKLPAPVFLMWLTGVCEIVGCLMLGLGIAPRIAASPLLFSPFSSASCSCASGPQARMPRIFSSDGTPSSAISR